MDEVLEEWNVFVGTDLTPFLHLCPFPSATLAARFNTATASSDALAGRFKRVARHLEVTLPFTGIADEHLSWERIEELQLTAGQKVTGAGWPWRPVQYMIGRFNDEGLFLTPVESVIPMQPSQSHLDEADIRNRQSSIQQSTTNGGVRRSPSDDSSVSTAAPSSRTIPVQFRRKETEEQVQARLNSFAYLYRQVDDEPWIPLKHYSPHVRTFAKDHRVSPFICICRMSRQRPSRIECLWVRVSRWSSRATLTISVASLMAM